MNLKSLCVYLPQSKHHFLNAKIFSFAKIVSGPKIWNKTKTNSLTCPFDLDFNLVNFEQLNVIMIYVQINVRNRSYIKMCKIDFRPSSNLIYATNFLLILI